MFAYGNINFLYTHFYARNLYKHFTHTNTKHKMSSKRYRRHFVTREYFRVLATQIIQKLFPDNTGKWLSGTRFVFEMFLYFPDNTGKWVSGIVLSRTEMNFDFLYPRINIKKTTVIYCKMKGKIDLFSHPLHFLCGCEKKNTRKCI